MFCWEEWEEREANCKADEVPHTESEGLEGEKVVVKKKARLAEDEDQ